MMKKRLLAALIVLAVSMFPVWCYAQEEKDTVKSGAWEYNLNDDGTVTIAHWSGEEEALEIPGELDGKAVTVIGAEAFSGCSGLKEITIPDSVTVIEHSAFNQCARLTGVTIPDSVREIGAYAFWLCGELKDLTISNSVTKIGKQAFTACAMTKVTIPDSVEEIGAWAFGSCHALTEIEVSPGNEFFHVENNALIETKTNTLIGYPEGLTDPEYTIPEGITRIGESAFSFCTSLESVTIPEGVTEIGRHAFSSCRNMKDIHIPESVEKIGDCALLCCAGLTEVRIPAGVTEIGNNAFDDCDNLTLLVSEDSYAAQYAEENEIPYRFYTDD